MKTNITNLNANDVETSYLKCEGAVNFDYELNAPIHGTYYHRGFVPVKELVKEGAKEYHLDENFDDLKFSAVYELSSYSICNNCDVYLNMDECFECETCVDCYKCQNCEKIHDTVRRVDITDEVMKYKLTQY